MKYTDLLALLKDNSEREFAAFQSKLIKTKYKILGVRTPKLRKIAKSFKTDIEELLSFPNEYYEVVFIKLTAISGLAYEELLPRLQNAVSLIDNWALCDSFRLPAVLKNKDEFLPTVLSFLGKEEEFEKRFALVCLLVYYTEEKYLLVIERALQKVETKEYFVYMAAAWLIAEVLIKHYEFGLQLLRKGFLDAKTQNKAIQKACESYRLTKQQKAEVSALKIKKTER